MDTKTFKAQAKKISFPGGKCATDYTKFGNETLRVDWHKRGGHSGANTISKVVTEALGEGFTRLDTTLANSPDGSYVGRGTVYTKNVEGGRFVLSTSSSYGVTQYENNFSITLEFKVTVKPLDV
jgi:hypothetical protein